MQILGQRDPKWGDIKLGTSNTFIKDYGCTITCIAMIVGTTPNIVNDRMKAVGGFANGNLVIWDKIPQAFPGVNVKRVWSYDNADVLANVPNVLVEVPGKYIGGTGKHWVVYVGNKKMYDPWTGKERPTSDMPEQSGYCVLTGKWNAAPTPPSTSDTYKGYDLTNKESMKVAVDVLVRLQSGDLIDKSKYESDLNGKQNTIDNLNQQINDRNNDITQLNSKISTLDTQLLDMTTQRDSALNQAKLLPGTVAERDELLMQRGIWVAKEKDYIKQITALKKENEKIQSGSTGALASALLKKIFPFL